MTTETALITGATSGIGYELAKLFARDHYALIICGRSDETLQKTAAELRGLGAHDVHSIVVDLAVPGEANKICAYCCELSLKVDVLVNDAGMGEHGFFTDTSFEKELAIINLNIISVVQLTKHFLREMLKENRGKILNLASIASYQPTPLLSVYAATKAFVLSFTDSLINEMNDTDITITALIPGATDTDFFNKANAQFTVAAQSNPSSAAAVAEAGYKALMEGKPHAMGPGVNKQIVMSTLLPNQMVTSMARKQMENINGKESKHDLRAGDDEIAYLRHPRQ